MEQEAGGKCIDAKCKVFLKNGRVAGKLFNSRLVNTEGGNAVKKSKNIGCVITYPQKVKISLKNHKV